jgi:hypothetical protein
MNKRQKIIILTGIGLILIMSLFPPWYCRGNSSWGFRSFDSFDSSQNRGTVYYYNTYKFIFTPPKSGMVDLGRLLAQWIIVVIALGGAVWLTKGKKILINKESELP